MNNWEIDSLVRNNNDLKNIYIGTFSPNNLPQRKIGGKRAALILNLCRTKTGGCHWVAIYLTPKFAEYFDSSGLSSFKLDPLIVKFLKIQKRKIKFNRVEIQGEKSSMCGEFSLTYLYCKVKGWSLNRFLKMFKRRQLDKNDSIIKRMFNKVFKK